MDIDKQVKSLINSFPYLSYSPQKKELTGKLFITSYDDYSLRIELNNYPLSFPHVYEIGERIPSKIDRHIYERSGRFCLTTKAKEQILLKTRIHTLVDFISLIVIPFLENNSFYEINRRYKEGEYSHGEPGTIEAYCDILHISDKKSLPAIIKNLRSNSFISSNKCFCGKSETLVKCSGGKHYQAYKEFNLIDTVIVDRDLYKDIIPFIREVEIFEHFHRLSSKENTDFYTRRFPRV